MAVKEEAGLSQGAIAVSAFRAYRNAFAGGSPEKYPKGQHPSVAGTDWDDLDEYQQVAWFSVSERALEILEDCENLPWVGFADNLFATWARRIEYPIQEFSELTDPVRAGWVAVARHIANLCALESSEDLTSHEERWIGAASRLGQSVGV